MHLTVAQAITLNDGVGSMILFIGILLLIFVIIAYLSTSLYLAIKSAQRYEPIKEKDKDEFYLMIKQALYKAIKAYDHNEPLESTATPDKTLEVEEKSNKDDDDSDVGFSKSTTKKRKPRKR